MKKIFFAFIFPLFVIVTFAQKSKLPLKEWNTTVDKPLVFYISGDGGYTSFSEGLCAAITKAGYKLTSLNSKSYFDDQKKPQQTTDDIVSYLNDQFSKRKDQQFTGSSVIAQSPCHLSIRYFSRPHCRFSDYQ